jgi:hypothetical protein
MTRPDQHDTEQPYLPGEEYPLPMRKGGHPITDAEALGVLRRNTRNALAKRTKRTEGDEPVIPTELPDPTVEKVQGFRLPARLLARMAARAEMEGRSLTAVAERLFGAYASGSPGTPVNEAPAPLPPQA